MINNNIINHVQSECGYCLISNKIITKIIIRMSNSTDYNIRLNSKMPFLHVDFIESTILAPIGLSENMFVCEPCK